MRSSRGSADPEVVAAIRARLGLSAPSPSAFERVVERGRQLDQVLEGLPDDPAVDPSAARAVVQGLTRTNLLVTPPET